MSRVPFTSTGHGYVWERPDGVKAKCGGPTFCGFCIADEEMMNRLRSRVDIRQKFEQSVMTWYAEVTGDQRDFTPDMQVSNLLDDLVVIAEKHFKKDN